MSSPVHHEKNLDVGLMYAPPWARKQGQEQAPERPRPKMPEPINIALPPLSPRFGLGGRDWAGEAPFAGDIAIVQLKRQLALDPDMEPQPPRVYRRANPPHLVLRIGALVAVAGVIAFALTLVPLPAFKHAPSDAASAARAAPEAIDAQKADRLPARGERPRMVTEDRQGPANEPLPSGIRVYGDLTGGAVTLTGLAPASRVSAGSPMGANGWRIPAQDIHDLQVLPPPGFVGTMNVTADLRLADNRIVDSQVIRLEWAGKRDAASAVAAPSRPPIEEAKAPTLQLAPDEIATLVKRGEESLKNADLAAARLLLRRAAEAGSAGAAFALGATYDPHVIHELGAIGAIADAARARAWYQKALDLGSPGASQRLKQLAQTAQ